MVRVVDTPEKRFLIQALIQSGSSMESIGHTYFQFQLLMSIEYMYRSQ